MKTFKLLTAIVAFVLLLFVSTSYSQTTVKIKVTLEWMAKNLNVSIFRNGDPIPHAESTEDWLKAGKDGKPAWCYYENDIANGTTYGKLYNWYAVNDLRVLAPEGWHVATDDEWQYLVDYLGGDSIAGGKLKETGTSHWQSPNTGATNKIGFSALPGGDRVVNGSFYNVGSSALFWSSSEYGSYYAWGLELNYDNSVVYRSGSYKQDGFSVRCVRD